MTKPPSRMGRASRPILILFILAWTLGPILVTLSSSFSTQADISRGRWLPSSVNVDSYRALMPGAGKSGGLAAAAGGYGHSLVQSLLISVQVTAIVLVLAVAAGFAFTRLHFRFRLPLFITLVGTIVLPVFVLVLPLFRQLATWHLMNTDPGIVLVYVTANTPLAVWIFYSYCRALPIEPYQAAQVDGCGKLGALIRVVVPQARSGMAALVAIVFLASWNQFLIPLLFTQGASHEPVTVLITQLVGRYDTSVPLQAAASLLAMLPPALVALAMNKHIRGMLAGWS